MKYRSLLLALWTVLGLNTYAQSAKRPNIIFIFPTTMPSRP